MFTTVAAYSDPIEAQIALGLLQAEGIPARLDDIGTAIANWEWRLAIGGVRLRVPDAQAMHARRVLAALEAGDYALGDAAVDGIDDPDAPAHTGHSAHPAHSRHSPPHDAATLQPPDRESLSSRIAWVALMLFGLPLPWRRGSNDKAVRQL